MKLNTHYIFSAGLLTLTNVFFLHNFYVSFALAWLVSVLGNTIIDKLGHEMTWNKNEYIPRRTPLTHTVPRSVMWGVISAVPVITFAYFMYPYHYFFKDLTVLLIDGALTGLSHMLLDAFTERGIYVKRNGKWRRFALAHFRYDDPIVNGIVIVIGTLMLMIRLTQF